MTAHNAAKSYNMLHAFNDSNEIDYTKIRVTYGNLDGARDPQHFSTDLGINFTWTQELQVYHERDHDQDMLLVFNPKGNFADCIFSGARRKAGKEFLEIPFAYKGSEFHTWIFFVSDDRMSISMSSYVGLITY